MPKIIVQESVVRADPSNSLCVTSLNNVHHGSGTAGSFLLYYIIHPSILFHHFGFSQLTSPFGWGSPLTILAPPRPLSTIAEQNKQQQEQSMLSDENSLPPHHLEPH